MLKLYGERSVKGKNGWPHRNVLEISKCESVTEKMGLMKNRSVVAENARAYLWKNSIK